MNTERCFLEGKKNALRKLQTAWNKNNVDPGIKKILNLINKSKNYYTSSSCYGRIILLEIQDIGDKKGARFLGKWHRTIKVDELLSASKNAEIGQIWILSQSPIIHIVAKTNYLADKILKTAISCGFKNSGLKSLSKKIVIEVCSTERLDAPIGIDGVIFSNKDHLKLLVKISNEIMKKSTIKLHKFEEKLKINLNNNKTNH
jgi:tRNA wybutosine-synthesizing protein 3